MLYIFFLSLFVVTLVNISFLFLWVLFVLSMSGWLVRLVESQGFLTISFPQRRSLLLHALILFFFFFLTLSLFCLLSWVLSIWMKRKEGWRLQLNCNLYYTSKWNFCALSKGHVYICYVWEKVLHSPAVWKWYRAIPHCSNFWYSISYVLNEYPKILPFSIAVWEVSSREF